jgi:hypothetical protein
MSKDFIPEGNAEFRSYIVIAHDKLYTHPTKYDIPASVLNDYGSLYMDYLAADDKAENPDTATKGNRDERNRLRDELKKMWRQIVNEWIRFNSKISVPDKEVFHVYPRDDTRTPAKTPKDKGLARVKRLGAYEYEVTVVDETNLKRKLPEDATGSYLYLVVSEPGVVPEKIEDYRKLDFSSNANHTIVFPSEQLGMQGNVYVRYANQHGKEGPIGPVESFFIN